MRVVRELDKILRGLEPLAEQGKIEGFFNVKNADKPAGLVEDIHDTVMEYRVRRQKKLTSPIPDVYFRLGYNKISTIRTANSL